jgi:hypothetical protein
LCARIANPDVLVSLGSLSVQDIGARRAHEFFETSIRSRPWPAATGGDGRRAGGQRIRFGEFPRRWSWSTLLIGLMLPCILLWALVSATRAPWSTMARTCGSWCCSRCRLHGWRARGAALCSLRVAQLAFTLTVYVPFFGASDVDVPALANLAVGMILIGALASSSTTASLGFGSVCNLALGFVLLPATL